MSCIKLVREFGATLLYVIALQLGFMFVTVIETPCCVLSAKPLIVKASEIDKTNCE